MLQVSDGFAQLYSPNNTTAPNLTLQDIYPGKRRIHSLVQGSLSLRNFYNALNYSSSPSNVPLLRCRHTWKPGQAQHTVIVTNFELLTGISWRSTSE